MAAILKNYEAILYKVKQTFTVWLSSFTPKCLSKRNESVCPQKYFYKKALGNYVHNSPKPETAQTFLNRWGKQIVVDSVECETTLQFKKDKLCYSQEYK